MSSHRLHEVTSELARRAPSTHEARLSISRALAIGMRYSDDHQFRPIEVVLEDRLFQGDWEYSIDAEAWMGKDRQQQASTALRQILADPTTPPLCSYRKGIESGSGQSEVSVPLRAWAVNDYTPCARDLAATGVLIDLVMVHGECEQLMLTRIEVNARPLADKMAADHE